jgi:protein-arginine kinase activator protein McsA
MSVDEDDELVEKEEEPVNMFSKYTNIQLSDMLQEALDAEDYEKATNIRDEINARKNQ